MPATPISPAEFFALFKTALNGSPLPSRLGIAVSGGVDSLALTHLLTTLPYQPHIDAFIVDHRARPSSTTEAHAVSQLLSSWSITPHIIPLNLPSPIDSPTTFELTARIHRYSALSRALLAHKLTKCLVAHHADDQAETVLMRLVSGTGVAGLAGMAKSAPIPESRSVFGSEQIRLLRPLLSVGKDRLVATCRAAGVSWWEDYTNADSTLTRRNAIRSLMAREAVLPRALHKESLLGLASRVCAHVQSEDAAAQAIWNKWYVSIISAAGAARIVIPEYLDPPDVKSIVRALTHLTNILTPISKPDLAPLRAVALSLLSPTPKILTAVGLKWTPDAHLLQSTTCRTRTWHVTRQAPPSPSSAHYKTSIPIPLTLFPDQLAEPQLFDNRFFLTPHSQSCPFLVQITQSVHDFASRKRSLASNSDLVKVDRLTGNILRKIKSSELDRLVGSKSRLKLFGRVEDVRAGIPVAVDAEGKQEMVGLPSVGVWRRGWGGRCWGYGEVSRVGTTPGENRNGGWKRVLWE